MHQAPRHWHVHNNMSRYLRYGPSHGCAVTPPPGLAVLRQQNHPDRFIGPTWGPPGSCRPHVGTMKTLLSGQVIAAPPWAHPHHTSKAAYDANDFHSFILSVFAYVKLLINLGDPDINFCIMSATHWIGSLLKLRTMCECVQVLPGEMDCLSK